jgi:hypothetical protein
MIFGLAIWDFCEMALFSKGIHALQQYFIHTNTVSVT